MGGGGDRGTGRKVAEAKDEAQDLGCSKHVAAHTQRRTEKEFSKEKDKLTSETAPGSALPQPPPHCQLTKRLAEDRDKRNNVLQSYVHTETDIQPSSQGPRPPHHTRGADIKETTLRRNKCKFPREIPPGDIRTTLTQTPSVAGPLQQQNASKRLRSKAVLPITASLPCPNHLLCLFGVLPTEDLWAHAPSPKFRAYKGCHQVKYFPWAPGSPLDI